MSIVSSLLHLIVFIIWSIGVYTDTFLLEPPNDDAHYDFDFVHYGGRLKFLTVIDSLLQCSFFGVCLLNDLIGSETCNRKDQTRLQKFRDIAFTSVVFPLGLFVSFIFWTLYGIDRDLIFPVALDQWFPNWLNHVMHTLPAVGVLLEVFMVYHECPKGKNLYLPVVMIFFAYLSWICYIAYAAGIWVYPVFEILSPPARSLFFAVLLLPNLLFVNLGQRIHTKLWEKEAKTRGKSD